MSGDLLPSDFETDNIPAEEDGRETTSGPAATTHYEDFKIFFSLATEASGYLKAVYRNDPTATGAKYISDRIAEAVKRISENPLTSGPAASECPTCAHRKKHFGWSAAFLCTDPWHETNARASFTGPAASAEHRCQELIVCNETREHAIHDPAERHHPFKESVESRTQGMSAERFYDSQQKFDFLCNRSHKSIMEFAEAYCEQETARLRAELETEQQDYGRLVKVLEKAEAERDGLREALRKYGRHMPECTSAFIKLPCNCGFEALIAAAPTKETDSPK
jgi:hypothetical protein